MMIPPVGGATAASIPTTAVGGVGGAGATPSSRTTPTEGASGFGQLLSDGLQQVSGLEHSADAAIEDLATGGPTRIEDVMIATTQAQLGIDVLARVRDRALEAYQEIMRMPL